MKVEDEEDTLTGEFYDRIKRAEAEAEINAVAIIQTVAETDWKARKFFLKCIFNKRWNKKQVIESDMRHSIEINTLKHKN